MMGRNDKPQKPLFYSFILDDLVSQDHLLRKIDRFLDLSDLREHLAPYYSHTGRPSIDTDAGIIVDVEATPAHRTLEVQSTKTMIERVEGRFTIKVGKLIGDTAYGSAEMLGWMVNEKAIEPHVPIWERGERTDGTFSRSDFDFDEPADHYTCPNGKQLVRYRRPFKQPRSGITKADTINYRSDKNDCVTCPLKQRCCANTPYRKVTRSVHEAARDVAREVAKTPAYRRSRRQRKQVEMLFAHMKRILKMDRLRLRGLSGAQDEFLLTATAQNLRRMAKYLGTDPPGVPGMA